MAENINTKIIEMLNTIREQGSLSYQNAVPILQEGDVLSTYGATILGQPVIRNEFLNAFTNFFMYEVTKAHIFESEFDRLKKIGSPLRYGTFESFTNTIKPMQYKIDELSRILTLYKPDVKTAYFTRTREDIFPMSIANDKLQGAFMSYELFEGFIKECYSAIVRSNKTVEYNAIKECINVNYLGGGFKVVKIPKVTEENAKTIAKMIRSYFHKMQKPSTAYNNYINIEGAEGDPVETSTPEEALLIITDADTEAEIGVDVLASMYNLKWGTTSMYENNHITVDDFGYNLYDRDNRTVIGHQDSKIRLMICDEATFKITDDLDLELSGYNDAALVRQNFYHVWQSINMRPWTNCVIFVEEDEDEIESITPNPVYTSGTYDVDDEIAQFTVTPENIGLTRDEITVGAAYPMNDDQDNAFIDLSTDNYNDYFNITLNESGDVITINTKVAIDNLDDVALLSLVIRGIVCNIAIITN